MNETAPTPATPAISSEWQEQCAALQRQLNNLLLALTVLSCTFALFVIWQAHQVQRQYELLKQQAAAAVQQKAGVDNFLARLAEFGRAHPDFVPILTKYGITPASATTPKPAAAAPKK